MSGTQVKKRQGAHEPQAEAKITGLSRQRQTQKTAQEPAKQKWAGGERATSTRRATGRSLNHRTRRAETEKELLKSPQRKTAKEPQAEAKSRGSGKQRQPKMTARELAE